MRLIDLFAGAGGISEGARQAGLQVVWCGNHSRVAVDVHTRNHPETQHVCQDLHQADWTKVPSHDIIAASPCCQGHTPARGKERPHHDASRATAWAVVSAAECHRPKAVVVENVPKFLNWSLFPAWKQALELLGYRLSIEVLDAQFFGVPQQRERVFIVALPGRTFRFPDLQPIKQLVPIREVLDLDGGEWFPTEDVDRLRIPGKRVLVERTKACIAVGRERFGKGPFWIPYYSANRSAFSLDRPIWTLATRDHYALVRGDRTRILTVAETRDAMGFPKAYQLSGNKKNDKLLLGNAVCPPVAKWLLSHVADAA